MFRIEKNSAARRQPALNPVCESYGPIVRGEFTTAFPGERDAHQSVDALSILRVQTVQKALIGYLRIGRQPKVLFLALRPDELSGLRVEIEHPELGYIDCQSEPRIPIVQPRSGQPALAARSCFASLPF